MPRGRASQASPFSALPLLLLLLCAAGAVAKKEETAPLTASPTFAPVATVTIAPSDVSFPVAGENSPDDTSLDGTSPDDVAPADSAPADSNPIHSTLADTTWPKKEVALTDFYVELTSVSNGGCDVAGNAAPLDLNAFLKVTKTFLEEYFADSLTADGYGYEALFLVFTGYGPSHRGCRRLRDRSGGGIPRRRGQEVQVLSKHALRFKCMALFRDGLVPPVSHLDDMRRTALDLVSYLVAINDHNRGVITSAHNIIEVQSNNAAADPPEPAATPPAPSGGAAMKAAVAGALLAMCVGAVLLLLGLRKEMRCLRFHRATVLKQASTAEDSFDRDDGSASSADFEARSVQSYDANSIMGYSVGTSMAGYSVAGQSLAGDRSLRPSSKKGHARERGGHGGPTLTSLVDDQSEVGSPGGRSRAESAEFHVADDADGRFDEIWGSEDEDGDAYESGTEVVRRSPPQRRGTHDTIGTLPGLGRTGTHCAEDEPFDQRRQAHHLTRQQLMRQQSRSSQFSQPFDERR